MTNIHKLLNQIASAEAQLQTTQFLAPCVKGGRVRTRVAGMLYTFTPKPRQFEGWGIFQPVDEQTATLLEEADLSQITAYLQQFPTIRLRLAYRLQHRRFISDHCLLTAVSDHPIAVSLSLTTSKLVGISRQ
jgi:hypothetical protein